MQPRILGIAGGTASGKSTLASALVEALGDRALHVVHDRYYKSLPEGRSPLDHNFDHPDALDTARMVEDLRTLAGGEPAELPVYEFHRHRRADHTERAEPREVVVVEGILVFTDPALRALMHHRVFVHTPDDIRLMRRIRRDLQKRGRTVEDVLAQYERTVRPMHQTFVAPSLQHAELVLEGTDPVDALLAAVMTLL